MREEGARRAAPPLSLSLAPWTVPSLAPSAALPYQTDVFGESETTRRGIPTPERASARERVRARAREREMGGGRGGGKSSLSLRRKLHIRPARVLFLNSKEHNTSLKTSSID